MKKIIQSISKQFSYSFKERIFILISIVILILFFTLPNALQYIDNQNDVTQFDLLKYANEIDSFIQNSNESVEYNQQLKNESNKQDKPSKGLAPIKKTIKFNFNPQSISLDSLTTLGLSSRTAQNFIKFRESGFNYRRQEDFKKIYNIKPDELKILNDLAIFPVIKADKRSFVTKSIKAEAPTVNPVLNKTINATKKEYDLIRIEINTATEEQWQSLKGIGPYYAMRICKFRDLLGGFISINQVAETYNLPDSVFQSIKPQLNLRKEVNKISILVANKEQLSNHPLISYKQAAILEKFIKHRKDSFSLDLLYEIKAFDSSYINKIIPYFEL